MEKKEVIRALQTRDRFFVAYSQATKLPFVTCDPESFNDQVHVFADEEGIKEYGKAKAGEKYLLLGMRYEKKDFPRFYGILYAIGVNSVVWNENGEKFEVELSEIARQTDFSKIEEKKRPLLNPTLQLSGIYLMQELRRPLKPEERTEDLRSMDEELCANLKKSEYLVVMEPEEGSKKLKVPYLKNKNGEMLQPVFTDVMELERFAQKKKLRALKVAFDKLPGLLIPEARAFVVNPTGFNLALNRKQLGRLLGREIPEPQAPGKAADAGADPTSRAAEEKASQAAPDIKKQ